jgi:nitroreductase
MESRGNEPALDVIHRHGSVREYKTDPLPTETIEAIVDAATRASTSSNMQRWSVVATTDQGGRDRLTELCGNQAFISQAPLFLTWCADVSRLDRACELRGYTQSTEFLETFLVAAVDVAIASQNAALAAEAMGLGVCYIGALRNRTREVIDLLELPKFVFPITGMAVGWPVRRPLIRPRLDRNAYLHWERYDASDQDRWLADYDRVMIETGIYDGRQVPVPGSPDEMQDYGWVEHSARRVSQPARTDLRDVLSDQGFDLR